MNIRLEMRIKKTYKSILTALVPLVCAMCVSCTDELGVTVVRDDGFTMVGEPVQVYLSIAVDGLSVNVGTRAEEPVADYDGEDSEEERHVDDLWIFEYDQSSGELIYAPQRVKISKQSELADVEVTLSNNYGKKVVVYVVANAGSGVDEDSEKWVSMENGSYPGFMTIAELEKNTIPTPHPQRMTWDEATQKYVLDGQDASNVSIPMGGSVEAIVKNGADVLVAVERMFAKIMVRVDLSEFSDEYPAAWLNTVTIGNIPEYCTVGTLWDGDRGNTAAKADYRDCERWLQRRFNSIGETNTSTGIGSGDEGIYPYIIYVPENIQGENGSDADKAGNIPSSIRSSYDTDALSLTAGIYVETMGGATQGEYASFTAYPGGNETTNFNVRRNCVYQTTLKITDLIDDMLPSANCIVCLSGVETAFWPYYREETGGGYDFEDYLYSGDDGGKKGQKISYVKIIWQSTDGGNTVDYSDSATGYIGDNSENEYVWMDDVEKGEAIDEYHRRIHVSIPEGKTGNALIGAYNDQGEIIWSWHVWSRLKENDPTTVNTKLYYTYEWDENGIYGKDSGRPRVAGYTIMNCNLGAMQDDISGSPSDISTVLQTFGTIYQWGRKDPFPPIRVYPGSTNDSQAIKSYDSSQTGNYFDNENNEVSIVNTNDASALFHSVEGAYRKEVDEMIPLTIQNPTVFYAGTKEIDQQDVYYIAFMISSNVGNFKKNYPEPCDGNWILDSEDEHINRLWGGLDPEKDMDKITKSYNTGLRDALGDAVHIYDNYGEKSIFDPCPYGWRVSPPDLWLGFTSTGLNPNGLNYINYRTSSTYSGQYGYTMYMTAWREGETSFFPTQGIRAPDGCAFKVGCCGNYNNATSDVGDRVNILHVHNSSNNFNIFEVSLIPYHIKSSANSLRCVRINSVQE